MKVDAPEICSSLKRKSGGTASWLVLMLLSVLVVGCHGLVDANKGTSKSTNPIWGERADSAQAALEKYFWNYNNATYYSNSAQQSNLEYWWQAHAIDVLVDAYERTGDSTYAKKISLLLFAQTRSLLLPVFS